MVRTKITLNIKSILLSLISLLLVPGLVFADDHIQANRLLEQSKRLIASGQYSEADKLLSIARNKMVLPSIKKTINSRFDQNRTLLTSQSFFEDGQTKYDSGSLEEASKLLTKVSNSDIRFPQAQDLIKNINTKLDEKKKAEEAGKKEEDEKRLEAEKIATEKKLAEEKRKRGAEVAASKQRLSEQANNPVTQQGSVAGASTTSNEEKIYNLLEPIRQSDPSTKSTPAVNSSTEDTSKKEATIRGLLSLANTQKKGAEVYGKEISESLKKQGECSSKSFKPEDSNGVILSPYQIESIISSCRSMYNPAITNSTYNRGSWLNQFKETMDSAFLLILTCPTCSKDISDEYNSLKY